MIYIENFIDQSSILGEGTPFVEEPEDCFWKRFNGTELKGEVETITKGTPFVEEPEDCFWKRFNGTKLKGEVETETNGAPFIGEDDD